MQHHSTMTIWNILSITLLVIPPPTSLVAASLSSCQANESTLDIQLNLQEDRGFEDLSIQVRGPPTKSDSFSFFQSYTDRLENIPPKTTVCIPNTNVDCLTAIVGVYALGFGKNKDESRYEIIPNKNLTMTYGGQPVNVEGPYGYKGDGTFVAARIGNNCNVECDSATETLLEIKAATGGIADYDWRIVDSTSEQTVYASCPEGLDGSFCYWKPYNYYENQLCLRKDGCYTLVAGESFMQSYVDDYPSIFDVRYNGNQIAYAENLQFEAIDFGGSDDSCPNKPCEEGTESLLEMFIHRPEYASDENYLYPNFTWSITSMSDNDTDIINSEGIISRGGGRYSGSKTATRLTYHRECIPKDSCAQFELSVPEIKEIHSSTNYNDTIPYFERDSYRVLLDGAIFGQEQYSFGKDPFDYKITQHVGDQCTASEICTRPDDSLMDLFIATGPREGFNAWNVQWGFFRHKHTTKIDSIATSTNNVLPNEEYRYLICLDVEAKSCTDLGVNVDSLKRGNIANYELKVNGTVFDDSQQCDAQYCQGFAITEIGGGTCPTSSSRRDDALSTNAIIGLSVSAVAVLMFLLCICRFWNQTRLLKQAKDDFDLRVSGINQAASDAECPGTSISSGEVAGAVTGPDTIWETHEEEEMDDVELEEEARV